MSQGYAKQGATARRTESALLGAAKDLIALHGVSNVNMIEIADLSQVSRATLYNHYRDKEAVLYALVASEVVRVFENSTGTPADILEFLSIQISQDRALAAMRQHDGALLVSLTQRTSDRIWSAIDSFLLTTMNNQTGADLALVWLMGQFLHPLSAKDSREQAAFLVERTLF